MRSRDSIASGKEGGKSDKSPWRRLSVTLWFGWSGGMRSDSGLVVKGVFSVPLCAKCSSLRSRIAWNIVSLSVISLLEPLTLTMTLSREPG